MIQYQFLVVNIPPTVTVSPSGPIQGGMVGSSQTIQCNAVTNITLSIDSVNFTWIAPGGSSIVNNSRLTISQITYNNSNYTSSLQFDYLMEGDEGNYTCTVITFAVNGSDSVTIDTLTGKLSVAIDYVTIVGEC